MFKMSNGSIISIHSTVAHVAINEDAVTRPELILK